MRLNRIFNTVNNKERRRGQWSVVWLKRGQPCLHHFHVLSKVFSWWPFSSFSLGIILLPPSLPPFILPLLNQCDRCLVPLAWGLMAGGHGFASHGATTLSRGWLCQGGSPWTSRAPTSTSDAVVNEVKIIKSNHNGIVSLFHPLYRA